MADATSGNDPIGDRLRSTFHAEHVDIERRSVTARPQTGRSRAATTWLPLSIAAALIAIAGFAFIGNRSTDTAVELETAAQQDGTGPDGTAQGGTDPEPTPIPPEPTPNLPDPTVEPTDSSTAAFEPGTGVLAEDCSQAPAPGPLFVWNIAVDDRDGGLVAHTMAGIDAAVTRILMLDEIVFTTGTCVESSSGRPWFQLATSGAADWASGRYLVTGHPACLSGEQYGTRTRGGEPGVEPDQVFGPSEGVAVVDGALTAFAPDGASQYRWYPSEAIEPGGCFSTGTSGVACLSGEVVIFDPRSPEPLLTSADRIDVDRTGRLLGEHVEVRVVFGELDLTGFVDTSRTNITSGSCTAPTAVSLPDDLASRPCAIDQATPLDSSGSGGDAESTADHIHNIRVEATQECVRVVFEFGFGVWTDADEAVELVPEIDVTKTTSSTEIQFQECRELGCTSWSSGEGEPQRVDFVGGSAFISVPLEGQPSLTVLHDRGLSSVTLLEAPARIVIDWSPGPARSEAPPIVLQDAILRPFEVGPESETSRQIRGYARPFESSGIFMVLEAPNGELPEQPVVVFSELMPTGGWIEGWGEFLVTVPDLDAGDYVLAFGEYPPGDDSPEFVGSGVNLVIPDGSEPWQSSRTYDVIELNNLGE